MLNTSYTKHAKRIHLEKKEEGPLLRTTRAHLTKTHWRTIMKILQSTTRRIVPYRTKGISKIQNGKLQLRRVMNFNFSKVDSRLIFMRGVVADPQITIKLNHSCVASIPP